MAKGSVNLLSISKMSMVLDDADVELIKKSIFHFNFILGYMRGI